MLECADAVNLEHPMNKAKSFLGQLNRNTSTLEYGDNVAFGKSKHEHDCDRTLQSPATIMSG
jgi:hypothetical protein